MLTYTNTGKGFEFTVTAKTKRELFAMIEIKMGCSLEPSLKRMLSRQFKSN